MSCSTCGTIAGVVGLAKATLHIDRTPEMAIKHRLRICWECDRSEPCLGIVGKKCQCAACGCIIRAKVVVASEACPIGRWGAVSGE
jgi:hypothetical protein